MTSSGSKPAWTPDLLRAPHAAADKSSRVRRMFNAIAPRYELVNAVFSGGRDAAWRRRAVTLAQVSTGDSVLDVACGTGDLTRAFHGAGARHVVGVDFAHDMLTRAIARSTDGMHWCEADALCLPFRDGRFDIVSCAFGVRNFQDLDRGLEEIRRVLRPGGRVVILEFTRPSARLIRRPYDVYVNRIMPRLAGWLSGDREGAYHYLPRSVASFLTGKQMGERLRAAGFSQVRAVRLTMGVVTVYVASRGTGEPHRITVDGIE